MECYLRDDARKPYKLCLAIASSCKSVWIARGQSCTISIAVPAHGRAHAKGSSTLERWVSACDWQRRSRTMPKVRTSVNFSTKKTSRQRIGLYEESPYAARLKKVSP